MLARRQIASQRRLIAGDAASPTPVTRPSEIHTRGNVEQHRLQSPDKWVPYGVGAIEGQASTPLPVLDAGAAAAPSTNGDEGTETAEYGPGEEPRPRPGDPTGSAHGELL